MMSSVSAAALHSQQHPHHKSVHITTPKTETGGEGTEGTASGKEAKEEFASKSHPSTAVSSALSLASGTDSPPSFTTFLTAMITAVTTTAVSKQTHPTVMFAPTLRPHTESALQRADAPPSEATLGSSHTGFQFYPSLLRPGSADDNQPTDTASTSFPSFSAAASLSPSSAQAEMKTQRPDVILPSNTTTEPRSHLTEYHNHPLHGTPGPPLWSPSLSPPPVCPYPPVPAHGTLYFHNVENPGPREPRHYIQYACYPGYTLARGDIHSFCQQGGTWSGITPVCLGRCCYWVTQITSLLKLIISLKPSLVSLHS